MNLDDYAADLSANSPTMTTSVTRLLRQAILEGALPGGSIIRQEEVGRKFGVSRVPIREALLKLEGEGLVETQPRRGVVVTVLSNEDFEEILDMRVALESLAIERSAQHFTAQDADAALALVEQARAELHASNSPDLGMEFESRWGDLNWAFHRQLYEPGRQPRLLASIEQLQQLFTLHLRMRITRKDDGTGKSLRMGSLREETSANLQEWAGVLSEHEQLVLACARHDAAGAIAILKHHISDHGTELVRRLRESGDRAGRVPFRGVGPQLGEG